MTLIIPIIHLNGTAKKRLIEERCEALDAARELFNRLRAMSPNGRDYYPKPGLLPQAEAQHQRRINLVLDLIKELEQETEAIDRL